MKRTRYVICDSSGRMASRGNYLNPFATTRNVKNAVIYSSPIVAHTAAALWTVKTI